MKRKGMFPLFIKEGVGGDFLQSNKYYYEKFMISFYSCFECDFACWMYE
ncbi:hypothetical protein II582_04955 [bacterium]|nr:hypothetical protein [bacterium]